MSGKLVGLMILVAAAMVGAGVYYAQVFGYYEELPSDQAKVELTTYAGALEPILFSEFRAIDAESSPIRYRACFSTQMSQALLTETYEIYDAAEPLNAPGWFECFDAKALGAEIAAGTATAFVGQRNFEFGIDRIVAITEDGRGYVWHQVNDCGDKLYDGSPKGDQCPERTQ